MNKKSYGVIAIVILLFLLAAYYVQSSSSSQKEPRVESTPTASTQQDQASSNIFKPVLYKPYYNSGGEGYVLDIPTGNESRCIWTSVAGNAAIPYIEVSKAISTEKHIVGKLGWDIKVLCSDDFGNYYQGELGK